MFSPTVTTESQAVPGVRFTTHRMGFGRRTDLDYRTMELRQRLRELEAEYPPPSAKEKELQEYLVVAEKKVRAVPLEEMDAALTEMRGIADEIAASIPMDVRKLRARLDTEYLNLKARINAEWIKAGLVSIDGGDFTGMTADQLLEYGPPDLAVEIYLALTGDGTLSGAESKNSQSPGTSGSPESQAAISTNASDAASAAGMQSVTASGTSRAA